jgi:hypothetical protein
MIVRLVAIIALLVSAPQDGDTSPNRFQNFNRTFQLELPSGWRQIAPNEAVQLSEREEAPPNLHPAQPSMLYTVGPIDQWLAGEFDSPWLKVIERRDQWYVDDDYEQTIRDNWQRLAESSDVAYEIQDVTLEKLGPQDVECIVATRTITPPPPSKAFRSLDVHAPTAQQQITLSFHCPEDQFSNWQPKFRQWLETLTFARPAQEQESLTDRLWTPLIVGAVVGVILFVLYKHTRTQP